MQNGLNMATRSAAGQLTRPGLAVRSCANRRALRQRAFSSVYSLTSVRDQLHDGWKGERISGSGEDVRADNTRTDARNSARTAAEASRAHAASVVALSPVQQHPKQAMAGILDHWPDRETTLRALAAVGQTAQVVTLDETFQLIKKLIPHLARHRMLATLPAAMSIWTEKVDDVLRNEEAEEGGMGGLLDQQHWEELQGYYTRIVRAFWTFARVSELEPASPKDRNTPLPLPVRDVVLSMVRHLLALRGNLPSSSTHSSAPMLNGKLARTLLIRRFLTPELRDLVLQHTDHAQVGKANWWCCMVSAREQGDGAAFARFRACRDEAVARETLKIEAPAAGLEQGCEANLPTTSGSDASKRAAEAYATIEEILQARAGLSISRFMEFVQPHLASDTGARSSYGVDDAGANESNHLVSQYAWSNLLHRTALSKHHGADDLLALYQELPDASLISHTATPVIHGLSKMGRQAAAWQVWEDLVHRHWRSKMKERKSGQWVDRVSLAAVVQASHDLHGLDATIALVDDWARRPCEHPARKLGDTLVLDAQNVNLLLDLCKKAGAPSIAFRLWEAALPRWGVWLDSVSLNILLDTVRFANVSGDRNDTPFVARVKHLKSELRLFPQPPDSDDGSDVRGGFERAKYAEGDTSRLLDPPDEGFTWLSEFGRIKPWEKARLLFREIVLSNWPFLAEIGSPLDLSGGIILKDFRTDNTADTLPPAHARLPLPNAQYPHVHPSALTFQSYIRLLGHFHLATEIPQALAWMRALAIVPTFNTMSAALLSIQEEEGPRRLVRGWGPGGRTALVSDGELMRRWLMDWLGDGEWPEGNLGRMGRVPSDEDLGAFRRAMMDKTPARL